MKIRITILIWTAVVFCANAQTASAPSGGGAQNQNAGQQNQANPDQTAPPPGGSFPPGLQQGLPPGLQNREQLPPGLAKRTNAFEFTSNQLGFATNQFVGTNQFGFTATNQFGFTNQFGAVASNEFQGLTPTANTNIDTNRIFMTNEFSVTNTITFTDQAFTANDQRLLITLRTRVQTELSMTVMTTALPVHFHINEGVVQLLGFVPTIPDKERVVVTVQQTPGVVRVIDQLEVGAGQSQVLTPTANTNVGTIGTNRIFITNQFGATNNIVFTDQAFTANDQRLLITLRARVQRELNPTVMTSALPVHFNVNEGVVRLLGRVPTRQDDQRVVNVVQETPGVVQVIDELQITAEIQTTPM